jgi:tetratricopeptide (TPR) repeat protein
MSEPALFGVETEYAFLAERANGGRNSSLHRSIVSELFPMALERLEALPATFGNGLFLANGSRFYLDAGNHPEFCTPECMTPEEYVRWLLAGERILSDLIGEVGKAYPDLRLALFRCNVDYSGSGATWGCHESFSISTDQESLGAALIPHLVSRIVITGAGGFDNLSAEVERNGHAALTTGARFLISPRVPHFKDTAMWSPGSPRALIHNRRESLSRRGLDRLHLMCGESLCGQLGNYLKLGCTALVIKLAEARPPELESLAFINPLDAMDLYSADPTCTAEAPLRDGRSLTAIQVQRVYLEACEEAAAKELLPEWAPETCRRWRRVLDQLEQGPEAVATQLDWAIKLALFRSRAEVTDSGNIQKAKLAEIDTRFGQIGADSVFGALDASGALDHRIVYLGSVDAAMTHAPTGGRADAGGRAIAELARSSNGSANWDRVMDDNGHRVLGLSDPFDSTPQWEARSRRPRPRRLSLPEPAWSNQNEGEEAIRHGYQLYCRMQLDEAIRNLHRATALLAGEPDALWEARFWLATCLQDLGRVDEADRIITETLTENRDSISYRHVAFVYSRHGFTLIDRAAPIAQIQSQLSDTEFVYCGFRSDLGSSRFSFLRARLLSIQGRLDEAINTLEIALGQSHADSTALVGTAYTRVLVRLCARAGHFERASEIIDDWDVGRTPTGPASRNRYRRTEAAIFYLYQNQPEAAYELVAPLTEIGGDTENRYSIQAACTLVRAALATDRLSVARGALVRALAWKRTKLGELRFEILSVHLAYLEACGALGEEAAQGELAGILNPSIANSRRALKRHARLLDARLDTNYWSQIDRSNWHG